MKIINVKRGKGKTNYLVDRSIETGYPILVATVNDKKIIMAALQAKECKDFMNRVFSVADVITAYNKRHHDILNILTSSEYILVDEGVNVLNVFLASIINTKIDTITMTSPEFESIDEAVDDTEDYHNCVFCGNKIEGYPKMSKMDKYVKCPYCNKMNKIVV